MHIHLRALLGACVLACSAGFAGSASGQEPAALDSLLEEKSPPEPRGALRLGEALALARSHHPSLRDLAWRVRAAQAQRRDSGKWPNPTLSAEVEDFGQRRGQDRRETTVRAEQLIELGGKRGARAHSADARTGLAFAELSEEERRVMASTAERFLEAWTHQERWERLVRAEQLAEQAIRVAEERHRAGASPAVERVRAEALHAMRRAERVRAGSERSAAMERLVSQWGWTPVGLDSLILEPYSSWALPDTATWAAQLGSHPERARATAEVAVEEARVREARAARVPDLTLQGGAKHLAELDATGLVVAVAVPLPLWNRGGDAVASREAGRSAARAHEQIVSLRLREALRTAQQRYRAARESEEVLRTQVRPKHEEALRQIAEGYRSGRFGSLELLDAQRGLLESELALIDATADAWRARLARGQRLGMNRTGTQTEARP